MVQPGMQEFLNIDEGPNEPTEMDFLADQTKDRWCLQMYMMVGTPGFQY